MKVVFRVDASLEIGSGHVMRCLTLADALSSRGAICRFICRTHSGNLIEFIENKGYHVHALGLGIQVSERTAALDDGDCVPEPRHRHWLGTSQSQDATDCIPILDAVQPDWLIVDHYAIDVRWERSVVSHCSKILVIDDLADRPHIADVLLDQNLGRQSEDYDGLVPKTCSRLIGPRFALLRPEFREAREASLARRNTNKAIRHILISMGGMDKDDATSKILDALAKTALPAEVMLSVVMGRNAPALERVYLAAAKMPWPTRVLVDVNNMAQLMLEADLAIGAGGSTTWECCSLGLPSIILVIAENQCGGANALARAGAALLVENASMLEHGVKLDDLVAELIRPDQLHLMGQLASNVCEGIGAETVAEILYYG